MATAMHSPEVEVSAAEGRLNSRAAVLQGEIRTKLRQAADEHHMSLAEQVPDTADLAVADLVAGVSLAEVRRDADELRDIALALQRLRSGAYGVCVACGLRIPPLRLEAHPTAKRCTTCQRLHERGRAARADTLAR